MSITVLLLVNHYAEIASRNKLDGLLDDKISLDLALKELVEAGEISMLELKCLTTYSAGTTLSGGAKEARISRWKFKQALLGTCKKLADCLGWEYTDKRLKSLLRNKYITGKDLSILRVYLNGKTGN